MKLHRDALQNRSAWEQAGFDLPRFDIAALREHTRRNPRWLHIGAGNIFRAFPAALMQTLLNDGLTDTGLIVAECFDGDIIERAYRPYDCLSVLCVLKADGTMDRKVIASVTDALRCDGAFPPDDEKMIDLISRRSLQLISLTITEKGYKVMDSMGQALPSIQRDIAAHPQYAQSTVGKLTAGLYERFRQGAAPIALMSLDNCSHNGDKLRGAVLYIAEGWREGGFVGKDFIQYLLDEKKVAFPISMIDKITPRPDEKVAQLLRDAGFEYATPFMTAKGTYTAVYVNAEEAQYLVVEDHFPNGRPPLEQAGVYFVSRDTVDKVEKMKVCACLNPLHTALAVLGCLLEKTTICGEMQDAELKELVSRMAYQEAMPVLADPGILSPADFVREVLEKRFPNPFMPDTPQRIATDTSQKLPIRFGETLKAYAAGSGRKIEELQYIPFVLAAYLRYLMAVDDELLSFEPSPDPLLSELQQAVSFLKIGTAATEEQLAPVLARADVFGLDLNAAGLAPKITHYLNQMLEGKGAVRKALSQLLTNK